MFYTVLTIHILASVILVFIVLLQSGRGAELGAAFGGMGQATFGRGQSTFISKLTTAMAVIFMATSLSLAFMTTEQPGSSVVRPVAAPAASAAKPEDKAKAGEAAPEPAKPLEQSAAPAKPDAKGK